MELLEVNRENFSKEELELLKMDLSEIPKQIFNQQTLQVRAQLMSKQVLKNLSDGWKNRQTTNIDLNEH